MSHYYNKEVSVDSDEKTLEFRYHDKIIKLISDHGVFSRERVDYGTRVLLDTVHLDDCHSLLDMGCGYGVIGLSIKMVYPDIEIDMVDINERAIALSKKGCAQNGLNVNIYQSDLYEKVNKHFDAILSNPPIRAGKQVVFAIIEDAYHHLNEEGSLWIVIQKKQGAPSTKKKMNEVFGNCEIVKRDKGYYILRSKR